MIENKMLESKEARMMENEKLESKRDWTLLQSPTHPHQPPTENQKLKI